MLIRETGHLLLSIRNVLDTLAPTAMSHESMCSGTTLYSLVRSVVIVSRQELEQSAWSRTNTFGLVDFQSKDNKFVQWAKKLTLAR